MGKSSGSLSASKDKSSWLMEDTRQLEARLSQLRVGMERERAERQSKLEAGRLWASSSQARSLSSKHSIAGRGNIRLDCSNRYAHSSQLSGQGSCPPLSQPQGSTVHHMGFHTSLPCEPSSAPSQVSHGQTAGISLAEGTFDEETSRQSFLAALDGWRKPGSRPPSAPAVDAASATERPRANGLQTVPVAQPSRPANSLFQRLVFQQAALKASESAAQVCSCRNSGSSRTSGKDNVVPGHTVSPDCDTTAMNSSEGAVYNALLLGSPTSLPDNAISVDEQVAQSESATQACSFQAVAYDAVQVPEISQFQVEERKEMSDADSDILVLSITDADPHEPLTARLRLPDAIILPPGNPYQIGL
jgi:hypothetical protein